LSNHRGTEITEAELKTRLTIRSGRARGKGLCLYAIMRNELFFLPAFFSHYRALGVREFYVLDDNSTDGTRQFLAQQEDCVLLSSPFNFGDLLTIRMSDGEVLTRRAGTLLKRAIPEKFLASRWAVYVDADEFLILPPATPSLPDVVRRLEKDGANCATSTLIEFYPQYLHESRQGWIPDTFEELIAHTPYFDATPFLRTRPGRQPALCGQTASARLFSTFGIREIPSPLKLLPGRIADFLPLPVPRAAWFKTPLLKWDGKTWMKDSHRANIAPPQTPVLAAAHFKFTADFTRRVTEAINRKAHARNGQKYRHYQRLITLMRERNLGFLGRHSKRYLSPDDLILAGHLC